MYFVPCQPVVIYSEFGLNYIYLNFVKKKNRIFEFENVFGSRLNI